MPLFIDLDITIWMEYICMCLHLVGQKEVNQIDHLPASDITKYEQFPR